MANPSLVRKNITQESAVVGSAAQVQAGLATHTSITAALASISAGQSILLLAGTYTENVTMDKVGVYLIGQGYSSYINGSLTFNASSDFSRVRDVRVNGNVDFQAGSQGCFLDGYQTQASTVTNSGTDNLYNLIGV